MRLGAGSSAINAGFEVRTYLGELNFDFEGSNRPKGASFDIGAIEKE